MRTLLLILAVLAGLLIFSTVTCGLWLRYSGEIIDESSRIFHMAIGLATAVVCMAAVTVALVYAY